MRSRATNCLSSTWAASTAISSWSSSENNGTAFRMPGSQLIVSSLLPNRSSLISNIDVIVTAESVMDFVAGQATGLQIPAHAAALRAGGESWLTHAFHAFGSL